MKMKKMEKKLYEAPRLAVVALQTEDVLLASSDGLAEKGELELKGSALVFRKSGAVDVWG